MKAIETIGALIGVIFSLTIAFAILFIVIGGQPAMEWIFPPSAEHVAHRQWFKEHLDIPRRVNEDRECGLEAINEARQVAIDAQLAVLLAGTTEIADAREAQVMADEHLATLEAWYWQLYHHLGRELAEKYPQVPEALDCYIDWARLARDSGQ
jgi:hypothetical protein